MTNWTVTEGYHAGVDYNYEYHAELNPLRLNLALLNVDLVAPVTSTACELGFGQGLAMNLHAAASTTQWFGTDFNPAHAVFAREPWSLRQRYLPQAPFARKPIHSSRMS
jgi:hypothetical protein